MALIPFAILAPLRDLGVPISVQYYTSAEKMGTRMPPDTIGTVALVWETCTGLVVGWLLYLFSYAIGETVGIPQLAPVVVASVPLIASSGLSKVAYHLYVGQDKAKTAGMIQVGSALAKVGLSVAFVLLGYGAQGAMIGYSGSALLTAAISVPLVVRFGSRRENASPMIPFKTRLRMLIEYGAPIGVSLVTANIVNQVLLIVGALALTTYEFGLYSAASNLALNLSGIFIPVIFTFLSKFTAFSPKGSDLRRVYIEGIQISTYLSGGFSVFAAVFSVPLVALLYTPEYLPSGGVLALLSLSQSLLIPWGSLCSGPLLLGQSRVNSYSKVNMLVALLVLPFSLVAIPLYGYYGMAFASVFSQICLTVGFAVVLKREMGIQLDARKSITMTASLFASFAIGFIILWVSAPAGPLLSWSITGVLLILTLFIVHIVSGSITPADARVLKHHLSFIPFASFVIRTMERIAYVWEKHRSSFQSTFRRAVD